MGISVVSGYDASPTLDLCEHVFDAMALPDLFLIFYPVATKEPVWVTPFGAG